MELARNKKAYFDYQHLETFDAGMVLTGSEVKSAKTGHMNLEGSYVTLRNGEVWLRGARISPYPKSGPLQTGVVADRERKLLLNKSEIQKLLGSLSQKGLTVVPLFVYSSRRLVKIKLALARGKRKFDKREAIKEKDYKRRLNSRVR